MKSPHLTPFMSASPSFSTSPMYCKAGNSGVGWKFSRGTCAVKKKLNLKKRKMRTNLKITLEVALQIRPQTPASLKCSKTEMCCHKNWTELNCCTFKDGKLKVFGKLYKFILKWFSYNLRPSSEIQSPTCFCRASPLAELPLGLRLAHAHCGWAEQTLEVHCWQEGINHKLPVISSPPPNITQFHSS